MTFQLGIYFLANPQMGTWACANGKHSYKASKVSVNFAAEAKNSSKLKGRIEEVCLSSFSHPLLLHHVRAPDFRHEEEVFTEVLKTFVCCLWRQVPIPKGHLSEGAALLQGINEALGLGRRFSILRDSWQGTKEATTPQWICFSLKLLRTQVPSDKKTTSKQAIGITVWEL